MIARLLAIMALVLVSACTKPVVYAPEADVEAARYQHGGPVELVLFNVVKNDGGSGEHSALMINAPSQRVLFDPAGSWTHPLSPEQHDVHFGFNDQQLFRYTYYHARRTHHVLIQRLQVSPEVAETVLAAARNYGPVPDAYCARSIFAVLQTVPQFAHLETEWYPNGLSEQFGQIPGVIEERVYSDAEPTERQQYTQ